MSKAKPTPRTTRRLNRRALVIVLSVGVAVTGVLVGLAFVRTRTGGGAYLAEARNLIRENKPANLILGYLNRYLEHHPHDVDALELKARFLSDSVTGPAQAEDAVRALTALIAHTPDGARRQDARRRLVRAALLLRDRPQIAAEQARRLINEDHADDAESHRMLAEALEILGLDQGNDAKLYEEARKEFEKAEAKDPGDVKGASQLAYFYRERLHDRKRAEAVFERLLTGTAKSPTKHAAALLARAEHYFYVARDAQLDPEDRLAEVKRREADILEAVKYAPEDFNVRIAAADVALLGTRKDPAAARLHLAAIPPDKRVQTKYKLLEGMIDLVERKVDDAIQAWRSGLVLTGGTDAEMTRQLAVVLLDNGRLTEAHPLIEQYRRLTGGDTPTPEYHFLHGTELLRANHPKEAIAELEPVRRKMKTKETEGQLYFALGMAYEGVRDSGKALDAYRQASTALPDWSSPWMAVARLQSGKDLSAAEATLRRGLAMAPNDPRLTTELAAVLWRQQLGKPAAERNWDGVERVLERARVAAPGSAELALAEAEFYRGTDRPDDAVQLLRSATAISPHASEVWLALANLLIDRGKLGEAIETLNRGESAEAAGPQAGFAILRARVLLLKGMPADARKALSDALTRVPAGQKSLVWNNLGNLCQSQGDLTSARAAFEDWARAEPENPEPRMAIFNLAIAANDDTAISRAIESLKKVAGDKTYFWKFAKVQDLLRARAGEQPDAARDSHRFDEAESLLKEIEDTDPQLALGFVLEAQVAERRKQVARAIEAYRKALDRGGGQAAMGPLAALLAREGRDDDLRQLRLQYPEFASGLERLAVVQALQSGNKSRAEELAAKAVEGDPKGLDVRVWQAEVLDRLGKPEAAESSLKQAIAQRPHEPGPWLALLMHQVGQRQTAAAASTIEKMRSKVVIDHPDVVWARCYRLIGDTRRAEQSYQDALRKWPNDANVLTQAIDFYDQIGRRDEAETALRSLLRRNPSNSWGTRRLALSLASRTGNRAAWEEAIRLVGPDPRPDDVPDDLYTRAVVYTAGPEPAHRRKAIEILKGMLAQMPDQSRVNEQLARLLYASNNLEEARAHAAKAAAGNAPSADAVILYGVVLLACNDIDEAESQLKRLEAAKADGLPVAELRAKILAARGKPAEAAVVLEKAFDALAKSPNAGEAGRLIVGLLNSPPIGQPEAAERVARRVAGLGARGRCLLAETIADRKPVEAVTELESAARAGESSSAVASALSLAARHPGDSRWLSLAEKLLGSDEHSVNPSGDRLEQVALFRHLRREFDKEIAAYKQIYASNPVDYRFLNNMAWTLSEELNRPGDGLKWADEAIKRVGSQPEILDTRGVILTRLARLDDAVKDLENAAAAGLSDPSLQYHLARVYLKKGDAAKATAHRELARKAGLTPDQLQPCDRADWDEVMK